MHRVAKIFLAISLSATVVMTAGVYATWQYTNWFTESTTEDVPVKMGEWGSDIVLPGGEQQEISGTSHAILVEDVHNDSNAGLNGKKPRYLIDALEDTKKNPYANQGLLFSKSPTTSGGNIKFLLDANIENLDFVFQEIERDQAYYLYTYGDPTTEGASIEVYRTKIEKQEEWVSTGSVKGKATVAEFYILGTTFYAVTISTFTIG